MDAYQRGDLSADGQLDAIWSAAQQNDKHRQGVLIADDVGLGKSRTAAGFALDRLEKGRERVLVITKNTQNVDNLRDEEFPKVFGKEWGKYRKHTIVGINKKHEVIPQWKGEKAIYFISAGVFAKWSDQLKLLRPDVIIADEVHAFKNIDGANIGLAWRNLHKDLLPYRNTDFMYLSATPGDDLIQLEMLYGLRVWSVDGFDDWIRLLRGELSPDVVKALESGREKLDTFFKAAAEMTVNLPKQKNADGFYEIGTNLVTTPGDRTNEYYILRKVDNDSYYRLETISGDGEITAAILQQKHADIDWGSLTWAQAKGLIAEAIREADAYLPNLTDAERDALRRGNGSGNERRHNRQDRQQRPGRSAFTRTLPIDHTEQIMRELKYQGSYMSRDLSRVGVEYEIRQLDLTPEIKETQNKRVDVYRDLLELMQEADSIRSDSPEARALSAFGIQGDIQADAKRAMFDLRLRGTIKAVEEAVANGEQVVISMISVNGVDPQTGGNLASAIRKVRNVIDAPIGHDEDITAADLTDITFKLAQLEQDVQAVGKLDSPVELLRKRFGGRIGFITGQVADVNARKRVAKQFQSNMLDIIVISGAGKTGISLHDITGNKKVHMFVTDYAWEASEFKQEMGRVDRAGQKSSPIITIMHTGNAVEKKFLSTIANRLRGLGATSKGGGEAISSGSFTEQFEFGGAYDQAAVSMMWERLTDDDRGLFLNRHFWYKVTLPDGSKVLRPYPHIESDVNNLRQVQLGFQQMYLDDANRVSAILDEERAAILEGTAEVRAEMEAFRSGKIIRELDMTPNMKLIELRNDLGQRYGVLTGILTPYMTRIGRAASAGYQHEGGIAGASVRMDWLKFKDPEKGYISGLLVRQNYLDEMRDEFKIAVKHTRDSVRADLDANDKIEFVGPKMRTLTLRKGQSGNREGKIIVDGALVADRDVLLANGVMLHSSGSFWYIQDLEKFMDRFPISQESPTPPTPDTLYQMGPSGRPEPTEEAGKYAQQAVPHDDFAVMWMPRDIQVGRHYIRGLVFRQGKFVAYVPEKFSTLRLINTDTGKVRILGIDGDERWVVARERNNWEPETLPMKGEEVEPEAILANGTVDAVSGIEYDSQSSQDAMSTWLRPAMTALQQEMTQNPEVFDGKLGQQVNQLSGDGKRELKHWVNQTKQEMSKAKLAALRYGERKRDFALLNYSKRYGFDNGLTGLYPYQFWYTRSMVNWMMRMVDRPYWASHYARLADFMNTYEDDNRPSRLRNKVRIPAP